MALPVDCRSTVPALSRATSPTTFPVLPADWTTLPFLKVVVVEALPIVGVAVPVPLCVTLPAIVEAVMVPSFWVTSPSMAVTVTSPAFWVSVPVTLRVAMFWTLPPSWTRSPFTVTSPVPVSDSRLVAVESMV